LDNPAQGDSPSLGEAFNAGAPEVEPVVVGRERWNDKPVQTSTENSGDPSQQTESSSNSNDSGSSRIDELDPLETEQVKPDPSTLPLILPKTNQLHELFETLKALLFLNLANSASLTTFLTNWKTQEGKDSHLLMLIN
jgi:hypothetical protein